MLFHDDLRNSFRGGNLRFVGRTLRNDLAARVKFRCWRSSFIPIVVSPSQINAGVGGPVGPGKHIESGLGQVLGGDWDLNLVSLETPHVRSLRQRFVDGEAWQATELWALALEAFSRGGGATFDGYRDFDAWSTDRLAFVDNLAHSLSEKGYDRSARKGVRLPPNDGRNTTFHQAWLDPLCSISRVGQLLAVDGAHRIALAKILEIDAIRVHVLVRHVKWQLTRDLQPDCKDAETAFRAPGGMLGL